MSTLGDLIVEHGPFTEGRGAEVIPIGLRMALLTSADLNALRGELMELRRLWVNVQALGIEYEREPRQLASQAVGRLLQEWLW